VPSATAPLCVAAVPFIASNQPPPTANCAGALHGGAISTIVDVVGTLALLSKDPSRAGVSIEMNQSFCAAAKAGERIALFGSVLRYGRSLGFTEVRIRPLLGAMTREEAVALLAAQGPGGTPRSAVLAVPRSTTLTRRRRPPLARRACSARGRALHAREESLRMYREGCPRSLSAPAATTGPVL